MRCLPLFHIQLDYGNIETSIARTLSCGLCSIALLNISSDREHWLSATSLDSAESTTENTIADPQDCTGQNIYDQNSERVHNQEQDHRDKQ